MNELIRPQSMTNRGEFAMTAGVTRLVQLSIRRPWTVILCFLLVAALAAGYFARNVAVSTDSKKLMSSSLPWRQQEAAIDAAFPQRINRILAVIDAVTPEAADEAAEALVKELAPRTDVIQTVERVDSGFFERNGILYLDLDEVRRDTADLISAQPFLGTLAADPTLRGVLRALSQSLEGVRLKRAKLDDMRPAMAAIGDALDGLANGRTPAFSWRTLIAGRAAKPSELRRFVNIRPVLDFADLEPGGKATAVIRDAIGKLGFGPGHGVKVRLTGSVVLSDEEFDTIADGAEVNAIVTSLLVCLVLWLALKKARIIFAVLVNLVIGLTLTAAVGLMMVGALNPISVAFAVLFVGLGVDFGIQFSVRYRAERHAGGDLERGLAAAARGVAGPLLLAAAAIATAFYSFLPTAYVGLSELGLIAGTGIIIAFLTTITLLPALLAVLKPPGEKHPVGYAALAPVDRFLYEKRKWIVGGTLGVTILALPLLASLRFDFNPLNLRDQKSEAMATLLELMNDPDTTPNTIDILKPSLPEALRVAEALRRLPQVRQVLTVQSFVPDDQEAKLKEIQQAAQTLEATINPKEIDPPPTEQETIDDLTATADSLMRVAGDQAGTGADAARRAAGLFRRLANADQATRTKAATVFVPPLQLSLNDLRQALKPTKITVDNLPSDLKSDWLASDGQARVEVLPKGDPNDNDVLRAFANAVLKVEPSATGAAVSFLESGRTIVRAFIEAGIWALVAIALLLWIALRRISDVLLTLVPLLLAGVVTMEICTLVDLPLNFANIIALPLLLGVGVAFKIYYIMAWRAGKTSLLQSTLTRAVIFSAMTTATAFGSLWLSNHPGTSSMGKLMALALVCTLAAAVLFQPVLMGPPRETT